MNARLLPRLTVLMLLATICVVVLASTAWACPGCKDALAAEDGTSGSYITGFFWSILFMMSMPFLILGSFAGAMYVAVRRARAAEAAKQATLHRTNAQPVESDQTLVEA